MDVQDFRSETSAVQLSCKFIKLTVVLRALSFKKVRQALAIHANLGWVWPSDNAKPNREISMVFYKCHWTAEWPSTFQCRGRNNAGYKPTKPLSLSNIITCYSLLRTEANIYKAYPKSHLFEDAFPRCLLSNCLLPSLKGGVVCTRSPLLSFLYWMSHHWGEPAVVSFVHTCVIKEYTGRHISVGWLCCFY